MNFTEKNDKKTKYGLKFHHMGLAAKCPEKTIRFLKGLGYTIHKSIHDPSQNVNLIMCKSNSGMPTIEIVYPTEIKGPIENILSKNDTSIYHLCFETDNINTTLTKIKKDHNKVICISPPKKAVLFENHLVSFYLIQGFGIIELLER
jgi:methylmalonyl-CoA/ethylmalonyl-CoA epimerase